jgi:hypothetical protein
MKMTTRIKSITWLSCVLAGFAVVPTGAYADFTPFTLVRVQLDEEDLVTGAYTEFEKEVSSNFAQVGASPYLAKARASFGETGSYGVAAGQPPGYHAHAESSWSDAFTIVGGTGTGILNVSVKVEGSLSGSGVAGVSGPVSGYWLFASDTPITSDGVLDFLDDNLASPDGSETVIGELFEGSFPGSNVFSAEIPFTYGTTFYLASHLLAETLGNGSADFYGSSHFGVTAPNGSTVTGASGTTYALAAAVPEAETYALMLAGLGLVGFAARRARR